MSDIPAEGYSAEEFFPTKAPPAATPDKGTYLEVSPSDQSFPAEEFYTGEGKLKTQFEKPLKSAKTSGVLENIGAGALETTANVAGAPGDIAAPVINAGTKVVNEATGTQIPPIPTPVLGGSESLKTGLGKIGLDPRNVEPADEAQQLARAGGQGAAGMVIPGLLARVIPEAAISRSPVLLRGTKLLEGQGIFNPALTGFVSGAAGQFAENRVPEFLKPAANFVTQIGVGIPMAGVTSGLNWLGRGALESGRSFTDPMNLMRAQIDLGGVSATEKQAQIARAKIAGVIGEQNVSGAVAELRAGNVQPIYGYDRTSAQAAPNTPRIGDLEAWGQKQDPEGFNQRIADQKTALTNSVATGPSAGGDVAARLQANRDLLDIHHTNAVDNARAVTQDQIDRMGGTGTAAQYGADIRQDVAGNYAPAFQNADQAIAEQQSTVQGQVRGLGGEINPQSKLTPQQQYGEAIRGGMKVQPRVGSVADVLAKDANDLYEITNSEVPANFWNKGKTSAEDIQAALQRSNKGFRQALTDYAAFDLRRTAEVLDKNGNGTGLINDTKYRKWLSNHSEALTAYEKATGDPSLKQRFGDVLNAQLTLNDLQAQRTALDSVYPIKAGGTDAGLAEQYFRPGTKGAEAFQNYVRDTGGSRDSIGNLFDYSMSKLRDYAVKSDGTLDTSKFNTWTKNHADALSQFPSDLRAKFQDVSVAQDALDRQIGIRAQALRAYDTSVAKFYLGGQDTHHAIGQMLGANNPDVASRQLVDLVKGDLAALQGLRRDLMDYAFNKVMPTGELNGRAFQKFLNDNSAAINNVFDRTTVNDLKKVSDEIDRAASVAGGTAPNLGTDVKGSHIKTTSHAPVGTIVGFAIAEQLAEQAVHLAGSLPAAGAEIALGVGAIVASHMKAVGIQKVQQLISEATLHPELMATLLAKAPPTTKAPILDKLKGQLLALGTEATVSYGKKVPGNFEAPKTGFSRNTMPLVPVPFY